MERGTDPRGRPFPAAFFPVGSEEFGTAKDWMRDPCYDLGTGFEKFAESVHRYYADREAWQAANNLTRLVQWRFTVASAMVEEACK